MKKYLLINLIFLFSFFAFALEPLETRAATIEFATDRTTVAVGDTFIVDVFLLSDNEKINALEGDIWVRDDKKVSSISGLILANSAFSLWPDKPSFDDRNGRISFVGGVPTNLKETGSSKIIRLALTANRLGSINVETGLLNAYLNDGKGSSVKVLGQPLRINVINNKTGVINNAWQEIKAGDKTPPLSFSVLSGQDPSTFSGERFITFSTQDRESGIAYYEVSENGGDPVRSGTTYVLQDQIKKNKVIITAYDQAGNKRSVTWQSDADLDFGRVFYWFLAIILVWVLLSVFLKLRMAKNLN